MSSWFSQTAFLKYLVCHGGEAMLDMLANQGESLVVWAVEGEERRKMVTLSKIVAQPNDNKDGFFLR